ncbi:hypothetical protein D1872_312420 [compost metagenome]
MLKLNPPIFIPLSQGEKVREGAVVGNCYPLSTALRFKWLGLGEGAGGGVADMPNR